MVPNEPVPQMPLSIFAFLLLGLACVLFILAAVGKNGDQRQQTEYRQQLMSWGLACWVLYILLQLIGGLVK